jgi:hypothetical protein
MVILLKRSDGDPETPDVPTGGKAIAVQPSRN